ncbi:N-acetyldiaminopimelate deacetylase [Kyrpidia spormannii]|uniref:N-acetyl-diaminopimelate deacetylase n=2 Tax=Kyrpidia spormannii TaxID=2055160 RepID=A0ACA8ZDB9_9BACL|nr:N-acetyldiaminopimelate deacetylase [Kyrpidia spormannii]CAB3395751.1 N-acetyl-diaminopimelate deacetylase [Kyrpidia spormannii]CAB3396302.1 N-acetyl-diaminopimelate deacetylase [Kyrpidia spormannii]
MTPGALDLQAIRRDLHRIPEPGFQEFETQRYILDVLARLPASRIEVKTWRTGVLVRIKGTAPRRVVGYRADMDGLPVEEATGLAFRSVRPGYMHACGHDVHMTVALGVVEHFVHHPVRDDLVVVFQPAEEGPGGALPMRESPEFSRWKPDWIIALHVAPEYPVGTIALREGTLFAGTSELFIDLIGQGGHAAFPHRAKDMAVAAAHLLVQLQTVVARNLNPLDAGVVTIGRMEAGTKQNIIAERARLEGTIRALSTESLSQMKERIEALVRGIEEGFSCRATIDYGANYQQVYNTPDLTREFMDWAAREGGVTVIPCEPAMTGEDFGYFLETIPGFMFWLGVDSPEGLHSAGMNPDERAIDIAVSLLTRYFTWKIERDAAV